MNADHPAALTLRAAIWSLLAVWPDLVDAAQRASGALGDDLGTVQAWRPGSGRMGGASGPRDLFDAIIRGSAAGENPYDARLSRTGETLQWLVTKAELVDVDPHQSVPGILRELLTADLRPAVALETAMWIGSEDRAVRQLLRVVDDQVPLPRIACPACHAVGTLVIRTSAPESERPVHCTACRCRGAGCRCGMGAVHDGIRHTWTSARMRELLDAGREAA